MARVKIEFVRAVCGILYNARRAAYNFIWKEKRYNLLLPRKEDEEEGSHKVGIQKE
jgi:hypothetical protein